MTKHLAFLEKRIVNLESRLKRVEDELELSPIISSFDWKDFSERDKLILSALLLKSREGATTTEIAIMIGLELPESSGRTMVYARLKRIERISKRLKGIPIVITERKCWYLNYDAYNFPSATISEEYESSMK